MARIPARPASWRPFGNRFTRWLGRAGLAMLNWRIRGELPEHKKMVIIVAPHTSNWDFFVGVFAFLAVGARINWLGKHSIFRWPVRALLRRLGGIPVERHAARNMVGQAVDTFSRQPQLLLALAPEGTRRRVGYFKTGFLRIAHNAQVPILPVALDYPSRSIVVGNPFMPTSDLALEERACYRYFKRYQGRNPQQY